MHMSRLILRQIGRQFSFNKMAISNACFCKLNKWNIPMDMHEPKPMMNTISRYNSTESSPEKETDKFRVALVSEKLPIGEDNVLSVRLNLFHSGRRVIQITTMYRSQATDWKWKYIIMFDMLAGEEAYKLAHALDRLILACSNMPFVDKSVSAEKEIAIEEIKSSWLNQNISLRLVRSDHGKLQIKIHRTRQEFKWESKLNVFALPWLRRTITQILREYDDGQQLPPMPSVPPPITNSL